MWHGQETGQKTVGPDACRASGRFNDLRLVDAKSPKPNRHWIYCPLGRESVSSRRERPRVPIHRVVQKERLP